MIVNLPNWTQVTNGVSPWISGLLTSFTPAVYWEIGLAVGVGLIGFVYLLVSGGLRSLLGGGGGSDPMRGIPSGNSGLGGGYSRGFGSSRIGIPSGINTRVATYRGSSRGWGNKTKSMEQRAKDAVDFRTAMKNEYDNRDRAKFNQSQENRRKALARES